MHKKETWAERARRLLAKAQAGGTQEERVRRGGGEVVWVSAGGDKEAAGDCGAAGMSLKEVTNYRKLDGLGKTGCPG